MEFENRTDNIINGIRIIENEMHRRHTVLHTLDSKNKFGPDRISHRMLKVKNVTRKIRKTT